jgi:hypothetical protein
MIVHKVDHKKYDQPQLADFESPLTAEVESFLRGHITTNRQHKFSRSGRFVEHPVAAPSFQGMSEIMLADPTQFVAQSRQMASRLFDVVKDDQRISTSDLVICSFMEGEPPRRWLALFKMDPEDGFVSERELVPGGVRYILRRVPDVLPAVELQKCAFILPQTRAEELGYDLRVLDQQAARYGASRLVASFFIKNYLECEVNLNARDRTLTFVNESSRWIDRQEGIWEKDEIDRFKRLAFEFLEADTLDVTAFSNSAIAQPDDQDDYLEWVVERGLDELAFEPDLEIRVKYTEYIWFLGDYGLKVRISPEGIEDGGILTIDRDEHLNLYRITINTIRWDRVAR